MSHFKEFESLVDLYNALQTVQPSPARCRALGLYDHEEVVHDFYAYCFDRFSREPLSYKTLTSISRSYPTTLSRRRRRELSRLEDAGRIVRPDRFRGRNRCPLIQRSHCHE